MSTKVLSKTVQKKSTKELEAHGGPWLEALIVVWRPPPKEASSEGGPQERLEALSKGGSPITFGTPIVFPKFHPCLLRCAAVRTAAPIMEKSLLPSWRGRLLKAKKDRWFEKYVTPEIKCY